MSYPKRITTIVDAREGAFEREFVDIRAGLEKLKRSDSPTEALAQTEYLHACVAELTSTIDVIGELVEEDQNNWNHEKDCWHREARTEPEEVNYDR